jgi:transposase
VETGRSPCRHPRPGPSRCRGSSQRIRPLVTEVNRQLTTAHHNRDLPALLGWVTTTGAASAALTHALSAAGQASRLLTRPVRRTGPWRGSDPARETGTVPAPRKFDEETRARAVRMYADRLRDHKESKLAARKHVGELLDVKPATLRNWIEAAEREEHPSDGGATGSAESEEMRALRRRVAELERANEILKTASAFFAQAELDRRLK